MFKNVSGLTMNNKIYRLLSTQFLTMFVAIGIAVGSLLVSKLIPLVYIRRARLAVYLMGVIIIVLAVMDNISLIKVMLFLAGVCDGLFVVPINATLQ